MNLRMGERALELGLAACTWASLATTLVLVLALSVFVALVPSGDLVGVVVLTLGSVWLSAIAIAVAAPLGLFAGVYLSEFAKVRERRMLEPVLAALAGVPTVIYGLLALVFLGRVLPPFLGAGVMLGLMLVPSVAIGCADALRSVARRLREGAWALGAGERQTLGAVVLPAASRGIKAAILLACARAFGEAMIVTIAAGSMGVIDMGMHDAPPLASTLASEVLLLSQRTSASDPGSLAGTLVLAASVLFAVNVALHLGVRRLRRGGGGSASLPDERGGAHRGSMAEPATAADRRFRSLCVTAVRVPIVCMVVALLGLTVLALPGLADPAWMLTWLWTSLGLAALTAALAIPAGLGAAIHLEEFSRSDRGVHRLLEFNIGQLVSLPPVLYGLLGLLVFAAVQFGAAGLGVSGSGALAGVACMALMTLPLVTDGARAALREVPHHHREAGLALGASRWQVVRRVVLPRARPAMIEASLWAMVRAIGEVAPLLVVAGFVLANGATLGRTLPMAVFDRHLLDPSLAAAPALLLLLLTLALSIAATLLGNRRARFMVERQEGRR